MKENGLIRETSKVFQQKAAEILKKEGFESVKKKENYRQKRIWIKK